MDGAYQIFANRGFGGHYESGYDVVIFRLKEKEPVILDPAKWSADGLTEIPPFYHTLNVELLWSASGSNLKQDRLRFDHVREENPDQSAVHMHVHTDIEIYMLIEAIGNTILKTASTSRFPAMC